MPTVDCSAPPAAGRRAPPGWVSEQAQRWVSEQAQRPPAPRRGGCGQCGVFACLGAALGCEEPPLPPEVEDVWHEDTLGVPSVWGRRPAPPQAAYSSSAAKDVAPAPKKERMCTISMNDCLDPPVADDEIHCVRTGRGAGA